MGGHDCNPAHRAGNSVYLVTWVARQKKVLEPNTQEGKKRRKGKERKKQETGQKKKREWKEKGELFTLWEPVHNGLLYFFGSYTSIHAVLMRFMHICRNSRTFVVMQERFRFTHFGSSKNCDSGLRAKKTEFPASCIILWLPQHEILMHSNLLSSP